MPRAESFATMLIFATIAAVLVRDPVLAVTSVRGMASRTPPTWFLRDCEPLRAPVLAGYFVVVASVRATDGGAGIHRRRCSRSS